MPRAPRTPTNTRIDTPTPAEAAAAELTTLPDLAYASPAAGDVVEVDNSQAVTVTVPDTADLMQTEEDWREPSPFTNVTLDLDADWPTPGDAAVTTGAAYDWTADDRTAELFTTDADTLRAHLYRDPQPTTVREYVFIAIGAAGANAPYGPDTGVFREDLARVIGDWAVAGINALNTNGPTLDAIAADHRASVGQ